MLDHKGELLETVFEPQVIKGKSYKQQYPELNTIEEFKTLKNEDLLFVWWYACKSSPLNDRERRLDNRQKACMAMDRAYYHLDEIKKSQYSSGKFPQHIHYALQRMSDINPSVRNVAKTSSEKIFAMLDKISNINFSDLCEEESGLLDLDKAKKYTEMAFKISEGLPKLVETVEIGYGVTKKARNLKDEAGNMNIADTTLNEEEN